MKAEIRMAIRQEGEFIIARLVLPPETLEQAPIVATIRKTAAEMPGVFDAFKDLCTVAVRALIEDVAGIAVSHVELREPPEDEKVGHA